jgi:hypothetical protein
MTNMDTQSAVTPLYYAGEEVTRAQVVRLATRLIGADAITIVRSLRTSSPSPQARAFRSRLEPEIWRAISAAVHDEPRGVALALIDLTRAVLALDSPTRERTISYSRRWNSRRSEQLSSVLGGLDDISESALFLASFKPRGPIVPPPFGLTAEMLLLAHDTPPQRDMLILDWFTGSDQ